MHSSNILNNTETVLSLIQPQLKIASGSRPTHRPFPAAVRVVDGGDRGQRRPVRPQRGRGGVAGGGGEGRTGSQGSQGGLRCRAGNNAGELN